MREDRPLDTYRDAARGTRRSAAQTVYGRRTSNRRRFCARRLPYAPPSSSGRTDLSTFLRSAGPTLAFVPPTSMTRMRIVTRIRAPTLGQHTADPTRRWRPFGRVGGTEMMRRVCGKLSLVARSVRHAACDIEQNFNAGAGFWAIAQSADSGLRNIVASENGCTLGALLLSFVWLASVSLEPYDSRHGRHRINRR